MAPTQDSTNSNQNFASCSFYNYSQPSQQDSQNNEALVFQREKAIDEENDKFSKLLSDKKFVEKCSKKKLAIFGWHIKKKCQFYFNYNLFF